MTGVMIDGPLQDPLPGFDLTIDKATEVITKLANFYGMSVPELRTMLEHQKKDKEPKDPEQLHLFEPGPVVALALRGHDWRERWSRDESGRPVMSDRQGRVWQWHEPVQVKDSRHWLRSIEFFIVQAMPIGWKCNVKLCVMYDTKTPHYHCRKCSRLINYGELHAGSQAHVCLECIVPRKWGRQTVPDYD